MNKIPNSVYFIQTCPFPKFIFESGARARVASPQNATHRTTTAMPNGRGRSQRSRAANARRNHARDRDRARRPDWSQPGAGWGNREPDGPTDAAGAPLIVRMIMDITAAEPGIDARDSLIKELQTPELAPERTYMPTIAIVTCPSLFVIGGKKVECMTI